MFTTRLISIRSARRACDRWHSHHAPPVGGLFAIGTFAGARLVCVGVVGRPVARALDYKTVAEVTRLASDGSSHGAASATLRACVAEAFARGFRRLVSYTLLGERGACYRMAGWHPVLLTRGNRQWSTPSRRRVSAQQPGRKIRWEIGPDAAPYSREVSKALWRAVGKVPIPTRSSSQLELSEVA